MRLWQIAWRYIWSRPLITVLTLLCVALGCALIAAVLTVRRETERALVGESNFFDMVVGAKGSPLQLVLSSIYHLDIPTGNIPYTRYEALQKDARVAQAIPIGLGDNYRGFRIVGTDPVMYTLAVPDADTKKPRTLFTLREGTWIQNDFEALLGSSAAAQTGLRLGQNFAGTHGLVALKGSEEHKAFPYRVVGILAPTGTSVDRAIYTTLGSVWRIHETEAELHHKTNQERQVTAVLIKLKSVGLRMWMADEIKNKTESMAAIPVSEMLRLYQQVLAPLQRALLAMAWLVVVVAALTILATLMQSAERRRRETAVLRALGAHPAEILGLIVLEAVGLTLCGIAVGWLLGHLGVAMGSILFQHQTGMLIGSWRSDELELTAFGLVALVGALAGLWPAWTLYRRQPARDLNAN